MEQQAIELYRLAPGVPSAAGCSACGTMPSRVGAKFCDECGNKFVPPEAEGHSRSGSSCRELMIQGFAIGGDAQLRFHEDDWDGLQASVAAACARASTVKEEVDESSDDGLGEIVVVDNFADHILALQESNGGKFRNGDDLQSLVRALLNSEVDPMTTDW